MRILIIVGLLSSALLLAACAQERVREVPVAAVSAPLPQLPAELLTPPRNLCLLEKNALPERFHSEWTKRCGTK